jgi:hypothetical protein
MRASLDTLIADMTERDYAVLHDVEKYRLVTTKQVQRLHFDGGHPTGVAAARACNRTLARLRDAGVLHALQRRIGGARAVSAGFVWYVGPAGERLLQYRNPGMHRGRRNYREPSRHFVDHTLAICELAVLVTEAARHEVPSGLEILDLQTEPASWQQSLSRFGAVQALKPDLRLVTASGDYERHWFIEVDMATEHLPVIVRQCMAYEAFRATGRYQASHGLFPAVVWVVPTEQRRTQLRARLAAEKRLDPQLYTVVTPGEVMTLLRVGAKEYSGLVERSQPGRLGRRAE